MAEKDFKSIDEQRSLLVSRGLTKEVLPFIFIPPLRIKYARKSNFKNH